MSASAPTGVRPTGYRPIVIAGLFAGLNLMLLALAVPGAAVEAAADPTSWLEPAKALLEHGAFVDYRDPSLRQTLRPPLYPLYLAGALWLGGGAVLPAVVGQIGLLFATGWLARAIVEDWLPGYGDLALALVVFNPNALGSAHMIQSDTLYAFLTTGALWGLLAFARRPALRPALVTGAVFALAGLVRSTAQYMLYVLPLAFPILGALAGEAAAWRRHLAAGLLSLALALALLGSWMAHNHAAGEGFVLTTARLKSAFLWDNVAYLEKYHRGVGLTEAEETAARMRTELAAAHGPGWEELSDRERHERLFAAGVDRFFAYPPAAFAEAFAWAWAQFYGIPGVSNLTNLLGLAETTAFAVFRGRAYDNYLEAGIDALRRAGPGAVALTVAGFLFVLAARAFGLVGLVVMIRRREWALALVAVAGIAYFTLVHLLVANSRYRLPIEPLLFLLAVYGLDGLRRRR